MSHLRSFFDRWQRLESEKAAISGDLKELFAEMKSQGFDAKAARIAFRQKAKSDDVTAEDRALQAMVELYLSEIDAPRAHHAPAHVRGDHFGHMHEMVRNVIDETGRPYVEGAEIIQATGEAA